MNLIFLRNDHISAFEVISYAVVLSACCVVYLIVQRLFFGPLRHVPGPFWNRISEWPLTLETLKGRRIYELERLHHKFGSIVRIGPSEVSVADWRYIRTIYGSPKTILKYPSFYDGATMIGKPNIFQMTDPVQHAARRKLSSAPYALSSIARLGPLIQTKAEDLVRHLVDDAAASGIADAYKFCSLFSLEVICKAAFAKDFDKSDGVNSSLELLHAMDGSAFVFLLDALFPFLTSTGIGIKLPGFIGRAYRCHRTWEIRARAMVDHFLEKSSTDDKYLLSPIATGVDSFLGRRLSHDELVEEAMGYMFAGSGTTSSTLTYLLYAISLPENIHVQERLRKEINGLSDIAVRQHPYVNAVIKETFRIFPTIVSTLPRILLEPLVLEGYSLPKGTIVGMQNGIHHRNNIVFPNPEKFLPERWLSSTDAMESSLTPFSIGRRNCIGQNLAWEELYVAVGVVMRAGLKLRVDTNMEPWEMEIEDRFNIAPRGRRCMLRIVKE